MGLNTRGSLILCCTEGKGLAGSVHDTQIMAYDMQIME